MNLKEKLLNGVELTRCEVAYIADRPSYGCKLEKDFMDGVEWVEEIEGENRRWTRTNEIILKADGRFFSITFEDGLTEGQEDEFYEQVADEVERKEKITYYYKTIKRG